MPATKSAPTRMKSRTATKSPTANGKRKPSSNGVVHRAKAEHPVLTLPEAARFLRLLPAVLADQALIGAIPGRRIGTEWRFLKSALNDWLGARTIKSNKEVLMATAGKYKDDPFLDEIVRQAYRERGRPMTEDDK